MPPHDGAVQVRYAVLSEGQAEICELSYDVEGAKARMTEVGLVQGYDIALQTGIWPSEDVLPEALRR